MTLFHALAKVGASHLVDISKGLTNFKLDADLVEKTLLAKPARALTLEEAAYAVAHLHHVGSLVLRDYTNPGAPASSPLREPTCTATEPRRLLFPGPEPGAGNRFTVCLSHTITHLKHKDRPIAFHYDERSATDDQHFLRYVDVRNVLVMYHLVGALCDLARPDQGGLVVTHVLHAGIRGEATSTGDGHSNGRAMDWKGVRLQGGEELRVESHWGRVPLPKGVASARPRGDVPAGLKAIASARWPVFPPTANPGLGWDYIDQGWRSVPPQTVPVEDKDLNVEKDEAGKVKTKVVSGRAAAAGLFNRAADEVYGEARNKAMRLAKASRGFTSTFFRLPAVIAEKRPGKPTPEELARAELVFRAAYRAFVSHYTVDWLDPYNDELDAYSEDGLGSGPTKLSRRNDLVAHPDHMGCEMRENHSDHFHGQVARLEYEYPTLADAQAAKVDAVRRSAPRAKPPLTPPGSITLT